MLSRRELEQEVLAIYPKNSLLFPEGRVGHLFLVLNTRHAVFYHTFYRTNYIVYNNKSSGEVLGIIVKLVNSFSFATFVLDTCIY